MSESTNIKTVADSIMNIYYGDYAGNTQFFDLEDFVRQVGYAYADLLSKEYDAERAKMRLDREENYVTFSHDLLQTQELQIVRRAEEGAYYKMKQNPMSFPYDKWDIGIQNIFPVGAKFNDELIRDSIDKTWQDKLLPNTKNVYWRLLKDNILVKDSVLRSAPPMIRVIYVPQVSEDLEIPNSRSGMITTNVLTLMRALEANHLVKEVNDQNKNKLPITENDLNLIKP